MASIIHRWHDVVEGATAPLEWKISEEQIEHIVSLARIEKATVFEWSGRDRGGNPLRVIWAVRRPYEGPGSVLESVEIAETD